MGTPTSAVSPPRGVPCAVTARAVHPPPSDSRPDQLSSEVLPALLLCGFRFLHSSALAFLSTFSTCSFSSPISALLPPAVSPVSQLADFLSHPHQAPGREQARDSTTGTRHLLIAPVPGPASLLTLSPSGTCFWYPHGCPQRSAAWLSHILGRVWMRRLTPCGSGAGGTLE